MRTGKNKITVDITHGGIESFYDPSGTTFDFCYEPVSMQFQYEYTNVKDVR